MGYCYYFLPCRKITHSTVSAPIFSPPPSPLIEDTAPTVHSIPSSPAIIGVAYTICLEGNSGGTGGNNFWTFDGTSVSALDISGLTNHDNANVSLQTPPLCDICSCYARYLSVGGIGRRIEAELERTGFAAFVVTMFQVDGVVSVRNRLCYGVPDRFLSVLTVHSIQRARQGDQADVSFSITSADNRTTTKHFNVATSKLVIVIPTLRCNDLAVFLQVTFSPQRRLSSIPSQPSLCS